jgi:hypothetical protein
MISSVLWVVDVGEPPLQLAVVGAGALDVEQVPGLPDAVHEAVLAQLPAQYTSIAPTTFQFSA